MGNEEDAEVILEEMKDEAYQSQSAHSPVHQQAHTGISHKLDSIEIGNDNHHEHSDVNQHSQSVAEF